VMLAEELTSGIADWTPEKGRPRIELVQVRRIGRWAAMWTMAFFFQ
jgi:hypothetical protein